MNRILILLASLLVVGKATALPPCSSLPPSSQRVICVKTAANVDETVLYVGYGFVNNRNRFVRAGYGISFPDGQKLVGEFESDLIVNGVLYRHDGSTFTYTNRMLCHTNCPNKLAFAEKIESLIKEAGGAQYVTPHPRVSPSIPVPNDDKIVAASSGTGFFVSQSGHIITNHHVIDGCKEVKVSFNGSEVDANVLAVDKRNDLAILKTALNPNKVFPVSQEDAALLDDVVIAGYPLGRDVSSAIKTSKGSVTSLAGYGDNYSEFQTDAALNQGNSGGPIMNQKGNVIGVAVSAYGKQEGVESFNFGIKASTLKTFAQSNSLTFLPPNNHDLSNSELGQLITNATLYLECWMTVAQIKKLIAQEENRKAFFSEFE